MKAGYRKFYKYFSILVFMGCGYLMLNFWEEGKGQISSYNMQDKALMILWFMIYTFGTAAGIINTLTSIYIYEWGMQISFLKYKKKIEWEEFSVIRRYHNHFFFNMSKQKDAGPYWAMFHPFTSFVIFDNSRNRSVHTMPLNADEFCELLTSYDVCTSCYINRHRVSYDKILGRCKKTM